jgi:hypothetical protein
VREVKENDWVIQFKAPRPAIIREQWYELAAILNYVCLNDMDDEPIWKWTGSKMFLVKSVYLSLTKNGNGHAFRSIWKAKIPEKIKKSMWLVA